MNELFKENLTGKGYQYIANWISSCRALLYKEDYTYIEFLSAAADICAEWEQHYEANKSVYEDEDGECTEEFQRALHYETYIGRVNCGIDYGKGKYIIPLENENKLSRIPAEKSFIIDIRSAVREEFLSRYRDIVDCLDDSNRAAYKPALDKLIRSGFNYQEWLVTAIQTGQPVTAATLIDFIAKCESGYKLRLSSTITEKCGFVTGIESVGISKSTYNDYIGFSKSEKAFDKKMFVNIAFLLGLSYPLAEKLLHLNGYTFEGSERAFDKICAKGFKLGFGRDLTNALIEKRNLDLGGDMIPNLQKNSKALNIANLLAP